MFVHTITVFNKIELEDECEYIPTILHNCFFIKTEKATDTANGLTLSSIGKAVIPMNASSDKLYSPPSGYCGLDSSALAHAFTLQEGDFIVKGEVDAEKRLTSSDLCGIDEAFQIKAVTTNDFSSDPCWVVSGI